ncbi:MAG: CoA ester lyase [Burkholderiaceae bacterium]|nr:CoA ester lyase [Burkholderiaceae bacterium]
MAVHSYLFVPGDRPERFDKAVAAGADLVILDLEDAVLPDHKAQARQEVAKWLAAGGQACVRVNAIGTEWHDDDVAMLAKHAPLAVMLPKAEGASEMAAFVARLPAHTPVLPLIESALGLWQVLEVAQVKGVQRLAFGSVDFQVDTGIQGEGQALLYARSRIVLASAVAKLLPPIDGVTVAIDNPEQLAADVAAARDLGFGAKLCIHPRQVDVVNKGFAPSVQELSWARSVVDAANQSDALGAIRLDGKLIDKPVVDRAKRLLEDSL